MLIIKVIKLFSFFSSRCFLNTREKVWENSKKLWKHSPAARVPTSFLVLPIFHSCLYNSIETRYMFSILKSETAKDDFVWCIHHAQTSKRKINDGKLHGGRWSPQEAQLHINAPEFELLAVVLCYVLQNITAILKCYVIILQR